MYVKIRSIYLNVKELYLHLFLDYFYCVLQAFFLELCFCKYEVKYFDPFWYLQMNAPLIYFEFVFVLTKNYALNVCL